MLANGVVGIETIVVTVPSLAVFFPKSATSPSYGRRNHALLQGEVSIKIEEKGAEETEECAEEPAKGAEEPAKGAEEPAKGAEEPAKGAEEPAKGAEEPAKKNQQRPPKKKKQTSEASGLTF